MFHYFNAVTNNKGDALIGYYVRAVAAASGSSASLYADESLTPIVSVSGLADAAKVNSDGDVDFYITGGTYHLDIYATDGTTFVRRIENIPMVDYTVVTASVKDLGAVGDGVADDTDAITAALASASLVHIPAGTYIVSSISIPANTKVTTDGFDTIIKQKSGTAANTHIISILASNVVLDDLCVEGQLNQAGDTTGEQNGGILIGTQSGSTASVSNVKVGNVKGTNIRGDVVQVYSHPTAYSNGYRVSQISVGKVIGSNVFRNVVSVCGGSDVSVESAVATNGCGYMAFDAEPDVGSGPCTGLRVGYIKGRCVQFAGQSAADYVGASVGHIDVDPSYTTDSSPAYGNNAYRNGLTYRNCKSLKVDRLYANGHYGPAILQGSTALSRQEIYFGNVEIPVGCTTDTTNYWYIGGDATTFMTIGNLFATTTAAVANQCVFGAANNVTVSNAQISLAPLTSYMRGCTDCTTHNLNVTRASSNGGYVDISGTRNRYYGGIQLCDYFFAFAVRCLAVGVDSTAASSQDSSGTNNVFVASRQGGTYQYLVSSGVVAIEATGLINSVSAGFKAGSVTAINGSGILQAAAHPALTGDVTSVQGALATTIANNAVTYAKFQTVAANSLVGNPTGSTANAQGITLAGGLAFSGTTLTAAGALTPTSVASTGAVTSSSATAGVGYASGARGTQTQATSKSTGVTSNTAVTDITLNGAALAAATTVSFVFTNSAIAANDTLILNHVTTGTFGSYTLNAHGFAAGSCTIDIRNISGGSLSEAIVIRAVLVKGG